MELRTRITSSRWKAAMLTAGVAAANMACNTQTFPVKPDVADRNNGAGYVQTNLVSDGSVPNTTTDSNLVNPWGLAFGPTSPAWVADNGTGLSTLYDGNGVAQSLVVTIPVPPSPGIPGDPKPTGLVYNQTSGFTVTDGTNSGVARFIYSTERGVIAGWSAAVPPPAPSTEAFIAVDNSPSGAIYKGLAISNSFSSARLYATDFHNGKVDVFDDHFAPIKMDRQFADPDLPAGFAPFGIANIDGFIYVTYAMQDKNREDDVPGPGLGYVNVFTQDGDFVRRLISQGPLNAPWGIAMAPGNFGRFSRKLLVANFGDGTINSFIPSNGLFHGTLRGPAGRPLVIDGLWAIVFGNGTETQPVNSLFFTAGPNDEANGLFGRIDAANPSEADFSPVAVGD